MDQQDQHIRPDVMEVPTSPNNMGMEVDIPSTLNNMEVEVNVDNLAAPEQDAEPWTLATLLASPAGGLDGKRGRWSTFWILFYES